jgi:hypothetical protein
MFQAPDRRRIYLLRHAEAAYISEEGTVTDDPRNVPLTATGRIQARKQSAILASVEPAEDNRNRPDCALQQNVTDPGNSAGTRRNTRGWS